MSYQQPPNYQQGYSQQPNTQYQPWQGQQNYQQQPPQPMPPPNFQSYPPMMPPQMPQQPPKKKSKVGLIVGIVVGLVLLSCIGAYAAISSAASHTNTGTLSTPASSNTSTSSTSNQSEPHFKVGDVVKVGDTWNVTINSAKTANGGQFSSLKSGDVYLVFSITVKNISNQEQTVSSALLFTLTDVSGQKYDETIDTDAGPTLDGKVETGSQLKGSIAYEIPKSVHSYQLAFEANITSAGQTIWDIKV